VDPVLDTLLLRKSGSAENRTRTSESVARNSDKVINAFLPRGIGCISSITSRKLLIKFREKILVYSLPFFNYKLFRHRPALFSVPWNAETAIEN
jgi:hypothetical protein